MLPFPLKLYSLLDACQRQGETSIVWRPGGVCFQVTDRTRFATIVMPVFFRTNNWRSFQRNLNLWGFRVQAHGFTIYFHEFFREGRPELCRQIVRHRLSPSNLVKRSQPRGIDQVDVSVPTTVNDFTSASRTHEPCTTFCSTWSASSLHLLNNLTTDAPSPHDGLVLQERFPLVIDPLLNVLITARLPPTNTVSNQELSHLGDGPRYQSSLNSQHLQNLLNSQHLQNLLNSKYTEMLLGSHMNSFDGSTMSVSRCGYFPEPDSRTTILRRDVVHGIPWLSSEFLPLLTNNLTQEGLNQLTRNYGDLSYDVQSVANRRWMGHA